jgi:hypothetical protein
MEHDCLLLAYKCVELKIVDRLLTPTIFSYLPFRSSGSLGFRTTSSGTLDLSRVRSIILTSDAANFFLNVQLDS